MPFKNVKNVGSTVCVTCSGDDTSMVFEPCPQDPFGPQTIRQCTFPSRSDNLSATLKCPFRDAPDTRPSIRTASIL